MESKFWAEKKLTQNLQFVLACLVLLIVESLYIIKSKYYMVLLSQLGIILFLCLVYLCVKSEKWKEAVKIMIQISYISGFVRDIDLQLLR